MKSQHITSFTWGALCSLLFLSYACNTSSKKLAIKQKYKKSRVSKKEERRKLTVSKKKSWSIVDVFLSQDSKNNMDCPSKSKSKRKVPGKIQTKTAHFKGHMKDDLTRLRLGREVISFDVVYLEQSKLDIPSFKQFKNNRTDFSELGHVEFEKIVSQIREYLGKNTDGSGVTLKIWGSASQIPTSFDPSKPQNNIHKNGASIKGQTNIKNNKLLAHARATSLADKIREIFTKIKIITPDASETKVGETAWTREVQRQLDKAYLAGDREKMEEVYAPFQKEQFVKVESHETFIKTIQPNSISMYNLIATPRIHVDGEPVKSRFIISKETYLELSKKKLAFENAQDRVNFLKRNGYNIQQVNINGTNRWYITKGKDEHHVVHKDNPYERILNSYEVKMVDKRDYRVLEKILTQKELDEKRYKYIKAN